MSSLRFSFPSVNSLCRTLSTTPGRSVRFGSLLRSFGDNLMTTVHTPTVQYGGTTDLRSWEEGPSVLILSEPIGVPWSYFRHVILVIGSLKGVGRPSRRSVRGTRLTRKSPVIHLSSYC